MKGIISLRRVYKLLSPPLRNRLWILGVLVIFSGFFEIAGVASIMPFIGMIVDPHLAFENKWIAHLHVFIPLNQRIFMIFLGIMVLFVLLISNLISAITAWGILRFSFSAGRDLSRMMFAVYLNHPYLFFLNRNTSELSQNTLFEIGRIVNGILIPSLTIISRAVIAIAILALLLFVNFSIALTAGIILGGGYGIVFLLVRRFLSRAGEEISRENNLRGQLAYETFSSIKDIKLLGREKTFFDLFSVPVERYSYLQSKSQMVALLPRYAMETLAFGGIISLILLLLSMGGSLAKTLPLISLYALAGYRLMPTLQQIFANWSQIRFNLPAIDKVMGDIDALPGMIDQEASFLLPTVPESVNDLLPFNREIRLSDVSFAYPSREEMVLDRLTLSIPANSSVGIVGATGSGKTTTLDIFLGLLEPTDGLLLVDNVPVTSKNRRHWQANIGYVPQQIMLIDDSVKMNIAFGIPKDLIDEAKVERAARLAHLHDFVLSELPKGYETEIGERGVRLSGGQRQRIGIARALYHDPALLVLDEATSALDNLTETVIMEALATLSRQKTILMVAHRLTTVRDCDFIVVLDRGRVADIGCYEELLERNVLFSSMVRGGVTA
jgi:ABC-type multidrug transport system fused ATPase/permease subunit